MNVGNDLLPSAEVAPLGSLLWFIKRPATLSLEACPALLDTPAVPSALRVATPSSTFRRTPASQRSVATRHRTRCLDTLEASSFSRCSGVDPACASCWCVSLGEGASAFARWWVKRSVNVSGNRWWRADMTYDEDVCAREKSEYSGTWFLYILGSTIADHAPIPQLRRQHQR